VSTLWKASEPETCVMVDQSHLKHVSWWTNHIWNMCHSGPITFEFEPFSGKTGLNACA
jgi:hypothetical protein